MRKQPKRLTTSQRIYAASDVPFYLKGSVPSYRYSKLSIIAMPVPMLCLGK